MLDVGVRSWGGGGGRVWFGGEEMPEGRKG